MSNKIEEGQDNPDSYPVLGSRCKFLNKYMHDSTLLVPKWENCQSQFLLCNDRRILFLF